MIKENVHKILKELPFGIELVAAAKDRTVEEIQEAIEAGVKIIGENYVQEAQAVWKIIGRSVKWHLIGHLQKNKVKKAVKIFDMIETVDSLELAGEIDRICAQENKIMPVLVEVNSGREKGKFGVLPEDVEDLIKELSQLSHIRVMGLMTMGSFCEETQSYRPYFAQTRRIFERIKSLNIANVQMSYLSMGMSNSYKVAIEEGANIIRVGTLIFGNRSSASTIRL